MTRTATGLCLAAAFGLVASLGAQSTTSTAQVNDRDSITVTGCLQRDASGGFTLANARIEPSTATGAYGSTTGATGTSGTTATTAESTWKLEGKSVDLDEHVGHRIAVTGKEKSPDSTSAATSTTAGTSGTTGSTMAGQRSATADANARKLDVKSVKMLSSSCS